MDSALLPVLAFCVLMILAGSSRLSPKLTRARGLCRAALWFLWEADEDARTDFYATRYALATEANLKTATQQALLTAYLANDGLEGPRREAKARIEAAHTRIFRLNLSARLGSWIALQESMSRRAVIDPGLGPLAKFLVARETRRRSRIFEWFASNSSDQAVFDMGIVRFALAAGDVTLAKASEEATKVVYAAHHGWPWSRRAARETIEGCNLWIMHTPGQKDRYLKELASKMEAAQREAMKG